MNDFEKEMKHMSQIIDDELINYLPQKDTLPLKLYNAMTYSVLSGGKRLRPILVMKSAEFFGLSYEKVIPTACGIEMIHSYSLIHDDLPAMDNDDLRRGKPTCHKKFGEAIALLAGDALLTHAFCAIASNYGIDGILPEAVIDIVRETSIAAGGCGMVGGQTADIDTAGKDIDIDTLFYISTHKTGALISVATWAGARLAGVSPKDLSLFKDLGDKIGLVFQIVDDILDVKGDESILGKPIGSDLRNHKNTFVSILGLEESLRLVDKLSNEAKDLISDYPNNEFFMNLIEFIANRDH